MKVNGRVVNVLEDTEYVTRGVLYRRIVYSSKTNPKIKSQTFKLSK